MHLKVRNRQNRSSTERCNFSPHIESDDPSHPDSVFGTAPSWRIRDGRMQLPQVLQMIQNKQQTSGKHARHVKSQRQQEEEEEAIVASPDAVVHPGTVMVKVLKRSHISAFNPFTKWLIKCTFSVASHSKYAFNGIFTSLLLMKTNSNTATDLTALCFMYNHFY